MIIVLRTQKGMWQDPKSQLYTLNMSVISTISAFSPLELDFETSEKSIPHIRCQFRTQRLKISNLGVWKIGIYKLIFKIMADCRYKRSYYLIFFKKKSYIIKREHMQAEKKIKKSHSKRKKRHKRELYFGAKVTKKKPIIHHLRKLSKYIFF